MRLHEHQAKEIFRQYSIPTPEGRVCATSEEAVQAAKRLSSAVIKAQVLVGGRGKAGGILSTLPENVSETASHIFGLTIKGLPVRKVLVEESVDIETEFYVAVALDRTLGRPFLMTSASGGVDIETVARTALHLIHKTPIDSCVGLMSHQLVHTAKQLSIADSGSLFRIIKNLYAIYETLDCILVEINPLVLTRDGRLVALDAKIIIDDNAMFRQKEMQELYDENLEDLDPQEVQARKLGMSYVDMDGNIGCIVNGAGIALATLDMISRAGGAPANFMDVRGGADKSHVSSAIRITTSNSRIKVLVINMFGGLTLCDEIAHGILDSLEKLDIPIVIRLTGTNQEKGWDILNGANVTVAHSTAEATRIAVEMVE